MRALSVAEMLQLWDHGLEHDAVQRPLAMLEAATGRPQEELAALPIGQRDMLLLALRECTIGPVVEAVLPCPSCGERLELSFRTTQVRAALPVEGQEVIALQGAASPGAGARTLAARLPDSTDLAAVAGLAPCLARRVLARRCVGEDAPELSDDLIKALAGALAERDPQAEVLLDMACPACGHVWQALFDIAAFFWAEISSQAARLFGEVAALARAYGWRESDILALSARRRRAYLDLMEA